jgi:hypothetical protein
MARYLILSTKDRNLNDALEELEVLGWGLEAVLERAGKTHASAKKFTIKAALVVDASEDLWALMQAIDAHTLDGRNAQV